jgi:hypothetical protein
VETLQLAGEMLPVAERVGQAGQTGHGAFSASADGTLVYASSGVLDAQLTFVDRRGTPIGTVGSPAFGPDAAISRDERQVAYATAPGAPRGLFLQQAAGGPPTQIVAGDRGVVSPVWSPDGRIGFAKVGVRYELFIKQLGGAAQEESLGVSAPNAQPLDWSVDGRWIAYRATDNKTGIDLWMLPVGGDRKPVVFLQTPALETNATFSPDGKWMAYSQGDVGRLEIFVQAISPAGSAAGIQYRISPNGGGLPRWRRDGKALELVYVSSGRSLIAVPVTLRGTVQTGTPQKLFDLPPGASFQDMTADAQRFLISVPVGNAAQSNALTVVLNWQARVK